MTRQAVPRAPLTQGSGDGATPPLGCWRGCRRRMGNLKVGYPFILCSIIPLPPATKQKKNEKRRKKQGGGVVSGGGVRRASRRQCHHGQIANGGVRKRGGGRHDRRERRTGDARTSEQSRHPDPCQTCALRMARAPFSVLFCHPLSLPSPSATAFLGSRGEGGRRRTSTPGTIGSPFMYVHWRR